MVCLCFDPGSAGQEQDVGLSLFVGHLLHLVVPYASRGSIEG